MAENVEAAVSAGVDWVQVRERDMDGATLLAFAEAITSGSNCEPPRSPIQATASACDQASL